MIPPGYFPFTKPQYELKIGALPFRPQDTLIETDAHLERDLALKRECMAHDPRYYFQSLPGSTQAQSEATQVIGEPLAENLREVGDRVQEDLLILDAAQPGLPLIAGHLCFANAWCLGDKMGKPFMAIHDTVPGFGRGIGPSSEKLLERLKPERPVWRLNWAVKSTGQLDLTCRWDDFVAHCNAQVTATNAGDACWMRVERQTLSRLPRTDTILFTVRTYTQPVASLNQAQKTMLLGVLETAPGEMLRYKGIWPFLAPLMSYLSLQISH